MFKLNNLKTYDFLNKLNDGYDQGGAKGTRDIQINSTYANFTWGSLNLSFLSICLTTENDNLSTCTRILPIQSNLNIAVFI